MYPALVKLISAHAQLLTEIFIADGLQPNGSMLPESDIFKRDIAWINEADAIIAEVTNPSLGVGYEIAYAENLNKPILTLHHIKPPNKLSAMIAGNPKIITTSYRNEEEAAQIITGFLQTLL